MTTTILTFGRYHVQRVDNPQVRWAKGLRPPSIVGRWARKLSGSQPRYRHPYGTGLQIETC